MRLSRAARIRRTAHTRMAAAATRREEKALRRHECGPSYEFVKLCQSTITYLLIFSLCTPFSLSLSLSLSLSCHQRADLFVSLSDRFKLVLG